MPLTASQFEEAVRVHGPQVRRCLHHLTRGHPQDTDDLLQRTFECAWLRRDQFDGGALDAWLRSIARFVHLTWMRSQARSHKLQDAFLQWLSQHLEPSSPRLEPRVLQRCLDQLPLLDRRIVNLAYGRETAGLEAPGEEGTTTTDAAAPHAPLPRPHTDPEIARSLDGAGSRAWTADAVRKRRRRALARLALCLEEAERPPDHLSSRPHDTAVLEATTTGNPTMKSGSRPTTRPVPRLLLARLLEDRDSPALEQLRERLADDPVARRQLTRMLALEDALAAPVWEVLWQRTDGEALEALPLELERKLLATPAVLRGERTLTTASAPDRILPPEQPVPRPLRVVPSVVPPASDRAPEPANTHVRPAGALALAAVVLLSVGLWHLRRGVEPVNPAPDAGVRGPSSAEELSSSPPPLTLLVQPPEALNAEPARLEALEDGHWRAYVSRDALIQLRVVRPERVPVDARWTVSATLARLRPTGEVIALEASPLQGEGPSTALEIPVGPAIALPDLPAIGFGPGDALVMDVQRGAERFVLEVVPAP